MKDQREEPASPVADEAIVDVGALAGVGAELDAEEAAEATVEQAVETAVPPADDRDVIEIQVELTDDTFDVEGKTHDQVGIKVRMPVRLKVGIAIVVLSFLMSGFVAILLPWAMATSSAALQWWCGTIYVASWIVLGIGVLVGGRSAKDIVTGWTVKAVGRRFGSLRRRRGSAG